MLDEADAVFDVVAVLEEENEEREQRGGARRHHVELWRLIQRETRNLNNCIVN